MAIELDPVSGAPLYLQLRDAVVAEIAGGRLRRGDALGSVRQVAASFGINPATVGKAYDALRREGLIRVNRKSGSVVIRDRATGTPDADFLGRWNTALRALLLEATAQGLALEEIEAVIGAAISQLGDELGGTVRSGDATNEEESK